MKDTKELRSFLVEQMVGVAKGDVDETKAKGVANLAQQVYNTLNIELKMAAAKEKIGDQPIDAVKFE